MKGVLIKSKKGEEGGFFREEAVKIFLAIIGIGILIYLSVSLYGIFVGSSDINKASASFDEFIRYLEPVVNGEVETTEVLIESPNKWAVVAWPFLDGWKVPERCNNKRCVCMCSYDSDDNDFLKQCDIKGFCKNYEVIITTFDLKNKNLPIQIYGPIALNINKVGGNVEIRQMPLK